MLHRITSFEDIDGRKLMDLYQEGNMENVEHLYPNVVDKTAALLEQEASFLHFIQTDLLQKEGNEYWTLEEEGVWVSALRTYRIEGDLYYIEALETRPGSRRRGHAEHLLRGVIEELKKQGPFKLCDCVRKTNEASIKTHLKCGFRIVSQSGLNYLTGETSDGSYGMQYLDPS